MTYAGVIVHVQAGPEGAERLACACHVAAMFEATLIGVGAQAIPPLLLGDPTGALSGDWYVAMRETVEGELKAARQAFEAAVANLAKPAVWESGMQLPTPALARASRAADLIVANVPPSGRDDPYTAVRPGDIALTSGRPVLVAPHAAEPLEAKRIVLAWKDTREARRALTDALPFLQRAEEVLVLQVCREEDLEDATICSEDIVAALGRHGVSARPKVALRERGDARDILHEAGLFGADLIVAGAYGHSRLGEWVFGGVTLDLLSQNGRYLLLSH
jgi:nucleotide-binding universal stress UspA family protein